MWDCERDRRLFSPGPKRILSLDGGGVRGIVALAFLERIEALAAEAAGRPTVLADHFDLIGGTSTGSIIATGLSLGKSVGELIDIYQHLSREGFRGFRFHGGILFPKFRSEPLMQQIIKQVGDETLGSNRLRTGLAIVAKRIDTGSTWLFHNNPRGRYYNAAADDTGAVPNRDLRLAQLIRASTAAPTFFAPQRIEIARGLSGLFVDGGVSPFNNPSLLLFMLATLKGYGFRWPMGADRLRLVSVGTGNRRLTPDMMPGSYAPSATLALLGLRSVMDDCSALAQTMLQWLGTSPSPQEIDSEIGDLADDRIGPEPLLRYQRYDMVFSPQWMLSELSLEFSPKELHAFERMDHPEMVPKLLELGRAAARRQVVAEHVRQAVETR